MERSSTETMFTTNSGTSRMFITVSFIDPSERLTTENARIGGDHDTPVKKLNGAKLVFPSLLIEDTQAIGRGIIELVRKSWACRGSKSIKLISIVQYSCCDPARSQRQLPTSRRNVKFHCRLVVFCVAQRFS